MRRTCLLTTALLLLCACIRPAEERSELDLRVGQAQTTGLRVHVAEALAAIRVIEPSKVVLWAQAPVLNLSLDKEESGPLSLTVYNCMPNAQVLQDGTWRTRIPQAHPTDCKFELQLKAGTNKILIGPQDMLDEEPYRFAVMGDIQTALPRADELFEDISKLPELRFLLCTGDIVQDGADWEYELYQEKLRSLRIPIFSTVGNHEVRKPPKRWHELFGPFSLNFRFKGVDYSLVDSGNASLDPETYERLQHWLDEGRTRVHIFGTHFPPFDPVGARNASFRSRNEGAKLLALLAAGNVDLTLYGHIHSYYAFENAGIPAYVSGGGGALPERYDGVGRHFLTVAVDPARGVSGVEFNSVSER